MDDTQTSISDATSILTSISMATYYGQTYMWNALRSGFDDIKERTGEIYMNSVIYSTTMYLNTEKELLEVS